MLEKKNAIDYIREYLVDHPDAKPRDVVAGLAVQGVKVSEANAAFGVYKPKNKRIVARMRKDRDRQTGIRAVASEPTRAGEKYGDRSRRVREYILDHPDEHPFEIVAGLAAEGYPIKLGLANACKYSARSQRELDKLRKARASGKASSLSSLPAVRVEVLPANNNIEVLDLARVAALSREMGGIPRLEEALTTLKTLVEAVGNGPAE